MTIRPGLRLGTPRQGSRKASSQLGPEDSHRRHGIPIGAQSSGFCLPELTPGLVRGKYLSWPPLTVNVSLSAKTQDRVPRDMLPALSARDSAGDAELHSRTGEEGPDRQGHHRPAKKGHRAWLCPGGLLPQPTEGKPSLEATCLQNRVLRPQDRLAHTGLCRPRDQTTAPASTCPPPGPLCTPHLQPCMDTGRREGLHQSPDHEEVGDAGDCPRHDGPLHAEGQQRVHHEHNEEEEGHLGAGNREAQGLAPPPPPQDTAPDRADIRAPAVSILLGMAPKTRILRPLPPGRPLPLPVVRDNDRLVIE